MSRATIALSVILGVSLLVNAMALQRLSQQEASKPEPAKASSAPKPESSSDPLPLASSSDGAKLDRLIRDVADLRREVENMKPVDAPAGTSKPRSPLPPLSSPSSGSLDPKVAELLAEQDKFDVFWKDLKSIQGVRSQLDEPTYLQAVLSSTVDYLMLAEPARSRFIEIAKSIAADAVRLGKQFEEERKAINFDPANPRASRDQWETLMKKYRSELTGASDRLKSQLDLGQPSHKQFAAKADSWITSYLAPDWARNWDRPWRGPGGN